MKSILEDRMETERLREKWKEVCFHLSKDIKPDIREDFFEQKILTVLEKLGWHQYKGEIKKKTPIQVGRQIYIEPDIVLYGLDKKPEIVIEVKRPILGLSDEQTVQQLTSYMRLLKADYGLLIGNELIIYYDGSLNPEHYPMLLAKNRFDPESEDGIMLIEILNRTSFLENKFDAYLHQCIDRQQKEKVANDLRGLLVSDKTKSKIIEFLKKEFADYGAEIVSATLQHIEVNVCPIDLPGPIQATSPRLGSEETEGKRRNELGHGFGTRGKGAEIDEAIMELLGKGVRVTIEGVAKIVNLPPSMVRSHIRHLRTEHGYNGITLGKPQGKPLFGHKVGEVTAPIEKYQSDMDIFRDFIEHHCLVARGASATAQELYQAYKDWAEGAGEKPLSQRTFGINLGKLGFSKFKGTAGKRYWQGVSLKKSD
jgi:hypothetical protein